MTFNLAWHLDRAARSCPEHPAVAIGTRPVMNYAMLAQRAQGLAASLVQRFALQPDDRVALAMHNSPEFLEILYACWHAGLTAVPINARLHANEFAYVLEHSGTRVCFCSADLAASLPSAGPRIVEAGSTEYEGLCSAAPQPAAAPRAEAVAWLFYTSGTTGRPKGAMLTHRNLHAMLLAYFADVDPIAPWRATLHAAPLSHGAGLYALAHTAKASCHVIPESSGFDAAEVHALLDHWSDVSMFAAPTMVKRLVDHHAGDATGLKTLIYGGGPMYLADCQRALERLGPRLSQLFGQGECPMTITALGPAAHADTAHPRYLQRLASVGIEQTPVQVRLRSEDGHFVPAGESGEIVVRGEAVMRGYWNDSEATAAALRDGWLHTGDIGVFDEDGYLTLMDRAKDLVISGGSNIYPREVEEALLRHPGVAEVAVIGVADVDWGESLVAVVVPRDQQPLDAAALDAHCLDCLARYKRPRSYRFVDNLPKNNYGKVLKRLLREQA